MPSMQGRFAGVGAAAVFAIMGMLSTVWQSVAAAASATADQLARQWVAEQGWQIGWDADADRLVVVHSVPLGAAADSPGFHDARIAAFEEAFAEARRSAAEFLDASVETRTTSVARMAEISGDPALARQLTGAAASGSGYVGSTSLSDFVRVAAEATLLGLSTAQTFAVSNERGGSVAVVIAWGPRFAAAIREFDQASIEGSESLSGWFDAIDDATLSRTWGIRWVSDDAGRMRPIGFGVARVRTGMEEFAVDQASTEAIGRLGRLQGERVMASRASERLAASREGSDMPEEFASASFLEAMIEANSSVEGLRLVEIGRRFIAEDPMSGQGLAVVAIAAAGASGGPGMGSGSRREIEGSARVPAGGDRGGCPPVEPRMQPFVRGVRASGTGRSESDAVAAALLDAIRREGAKVAGDARLSRRFEEAMETVDGEIRDKASAVTVSETTTSTFASGFVHSFEVVGRSSQGTLVEVEICANLVRFDPDDPRFGLPPTLAVLPWSAAPGSVEIDGRRASPGPLAQQLENSLQRTALRSNRFQVLDDRNAADLQRYRDEIVARAERGIVDEMELVKIGKALTADFVLTGEIERLALVDSTARTPSHRRVDLRVAAQLVNVADGRIVWEGSAQQVLGGRALALARAGRQEDNRPVEDPIEQQLDPVDLALLRASRTLQASLQDYIDSLPPRGEGGGGASTPAAAATIAVVRVASGRVTFESVPGLAVGDRYAVENPVEIVLGDGRKLEDVDRVAVVRVVEVGPQLSRAEVVEGDGTEIAAGRSRLVRVP